MYIKCTRRVDRVQLNTITSLNLFLLNIYLVGKKILPLTPSGKFLEGLNLITEVVIRFKPSFRCGYGPLLYNKDRIHF
jgi:hypothetical protein